MNDYNSHAFPTDGRIDDFLMQMRHLVNYTIIDCTSDVTYKLTAKSLINAEKVIYLISCDINGLVFHESQEPVLLGEQYGYSGYLKYLTVNGRFREDISAMKNAVSGVRGVVPYSESVAELWNGGKAFSIVSDAAYAKAVSEIAATVMED